MDQHSTTTTERGHHSRQPVVGHHAGNLLRTHLRGTCEHLLLLVSQPTDRHPGAGPAPLVGQAANAAPPACAHALRRPRSPVDPRASHALPTHNHPLPARPDSGSDDPAARRPQRHVEPDAPRRGRPRRTDACQDPARCGQRGRRGRGHRRRVRPDTRIAPVGWTPVAWTPDVRPTIGRTSARRTADADRATNGVSGVRASRRSRRRRPPAGLAQPLLGLPRLRRSGHPRSRAYAARRTALGNRRKEILRCVKRALARELYPLILDALALPRPS